MLLRLRCFFYIHDPLGKSINMLQHFTVVFSIVIVIQLYSHLASEIFLLTTPVVSEIAAASHFNILDKIKGIVVGAIILSVGAMMFSVFSQARVLLAILTFLFCFAALLVSVRKPTYHNTACIAIIVSSLAIINPASWYYGVSAVINIAVASIISILTHVVLAARPRKYGAHVLRALMMIYWSKLRLVKKALSRHTIISQGVEEMITTSELFIMTNFDVFLQSKFEDDTSVLLRSNEFRSLVNSIRLTTGALFNMHQLEKTNYIDQQLVCDCIKDLMMRLIGIVDNFSIWKTYHFEENKNLYFKLDQSFELQARPIPIKTYRLRYYLCNLNLELEKIEAITNTRIAKDASTVS